LAKGKTEGLLEGKAEGKKEEAMLIAQKMRDQGCSLELIEATTGIHLTKSE